MIEDAGEGENPEIPDFVGLDNFEDVAAILQTQFINQASNVYVIVFT